MDKPKDLIALKRAALAVAKGRGIKVPSGFNPDSPSLGKPAKTLLLRIAKNDPPKKAWHARLVDHAVRDVGVTERPPGSNSGPRINEALKFCGLTPGQPWCAAMLSLWLHEMGYKGPWPASKGYVPSWEQMAKAKGLVVPKKDARRGDIVTFQFDDDPSGDHIGLARGSWKSGHLPTVEGNVDNTVKLCLRAESQVKMIIRVPEP